MHTFISSGEKAVFLSCFSDFESSASLGFLRPSLAAYTVYSLSLLCYPFRLIFLHYIASIDVLVSATIIAAFTIVNRTYIYIAFTYVSVWTSHSNKNLTGIHRPRRLREICLRPQQQSEDIPHQLALPHRPRMTVMILLAHVVVGRDLPWPRSLHNYLQCGRRICRG